jgi:hypothetical protein
MIDSESEPSPQSQEELIGFLLADIDLAFALLERATIKDHKRTSYQFELEKAQAALRTIRKFEGQIQDPATRQEVHTRANELEEAIERFGE